MKKVRKNNNKYFKYFLLIVSLFSTIHIAFHHFTSELVYAAWVEDENGISYKDDEGELLKGFQTIKNNLYYFDDDGYLKTGKIYIQDEDNYYYADKDGIIQIGTIETDDYFYETDETGKIKIGFVEHDGQLYYFNKNADVVYGWFELEDKWYYAGEKGAIATGFITIDGFRYYLGTDGVRVSDTVMEIEGVTYIFNSDGSVDENATLLYPVYQYIDNVRIDNNMPAVALDSKVQACALLRAASLSEGFDNNKDKELENLLKNRAIKCNGGYELSYGGIEGYDIEHLISHMKIDNNLQKILRDSEIKNIGIGVNDVDGILYFDVVFIK